MKTLPAVFCLIIFILGFCPQAAGQHTFRKKIITISADTITLDTLSIQQNYFQLKSSDSVLSTSSFFIDYLKAKIFCRNASLYGKTLEVNYKVFPFSFSKIYFHKNPKSILPYAKPDIDYEYKTGNIYEGSTGYGTLNRSGSFSRGLSFGNNRDLVLTSFLDVQLSGKIAPGVEILASLNDRNIPLQPDGTTAQLQTFDQKYIQLTTAKQKIQLGDFGILNQSESYFLRYNKKVQGIGATSLFSITTNDSGVAHASLNISRGKWNRMQFNGINGNQGPYRLRGANGEIYVQVIAGTEKVYCNGVLLKRGEQNDYKIDYNSGEIIFTPNKIITQYDRIIIEFQYADRNYQRYLAEGFTSYTKGLWNISANIYHEEDNRLRPVFSPLSNEEKINLVNAGDSSAFSPAFDTVAFNPDRLMYKKTDSLGYKNIFVFSNSKDSAKYIVTFAFVGDGKGNYVLGKSLANGKIYDWVKPENNQPSGNYEPVRLLNAPQKQQVFSVAINRKLNDGIIGSEVAVSNRDENTFSGKNDNDNAGVAARFFVDKKTALQKNQTPWQLGVNTDYEYRNKNFTEAERYRTAEFGRTWNPGLENGSFASENKFTQHTANAGFRLQKNKFSFSQSNSFYAQENLLYGLNNGASLLWDVAKFNLKSNGSFSNIYLQNTPEKLNNRHYLRWDADLSRSFKILKIGVARVSEKSNYIYHSENIYNPTSYAFDEQKIYFASENTKHIFSAAASLRHDYRPGYNKLFLYGIANEYSLKYRSPFHENRSLKTDITYRILTPYDTLGRTSAQEKNLLSKTDFMLAMFNKAIQTSGYYELTTGKEPRRDYQYIQVTKGLGTHIWNDYNHNGIKELNEFEPAPFSDLGEYIKISVPSSVYVPVFSTNLQQTFQLKPEKFFNAEDAAFSFFCRFENLLSMRISNKFQNRIQPYYITPYLPLSADTTLVSSLSQIRNVFLFNKNSTVWGGDVTAIQNQSQQLLSAGTEKRISQEAQLNTHINLFYFLTLEPVFVLGEKKFSADYYSSRNSDIHFYRTGSRILWQKGNGISVLAGAWFADYRNKAGTNGENMQQREMNLEMRYAVGNKGFASAKISQIQILFRDKFNKELKSGSALSYDFLQGYQPGTNYTWQLSWNQRLQSSLQLSLLYEGRASERTSDIHTGRANVSWIF